MSLAVPVFGEDASLTVRLAAPELVNGFEGRRFSRSATAQQRRASAPRPFAAFAACPATSLLTNDRRAGRLDPH